MSRIYGKALLVITKHDSKYLPYQVWPFVQSATGGEYAHECAGEDLQLAGSGLPLPINGKRLKVGETVRVAVCYELFYSQDYWGEYDVDLTYQKVRVLRRQKPRKPHYLAKSHPIRQIHSYPVSRKHDDMVDALSYLVIADR